MTREEVAEIMNNCKEHKVTYKSRLEELNIPVWRFYDSKSRYAVEQSWGKSVKVSFSSSRTAVRLSPSHPLPVQADGNRKIQPSHQPDRKK